MRLKLLCSYDPNLAVSVHPLMQRGSVLYLLHSLQPSH
jgi:hypothetical protein